MHFIFILICIYRNLTFYMYYIFILFVIIIYHSKRCIGGMSNKVSENSNISKKIDNFVGEFFG